MLAPHKVGFGEFPRVSSWQNPTLSHSTSKKHGKRAQMMTNPKKVRVHIYRSNRSHKRVPTTETIRVTRAVQVTRKLMISTNRVRHRSTFTPRHGDTEKTHASPTASRRARCTDSSSPTTFCAPMQRRELRVSVRFRLLNDKQTCSCDDQRIEVPVGSHGARNDHGLSTACPPNGAFFRVTLHMCLWACACVSPNSPCTGDTFRTLLAEMSVAGRIGSVNRFASPVLMSRCDWVAFDYRLEW